MKDIERSFNSAVDYAKTLVDFQNMTWSIPVPDEPLLIFYSNGNLGRIHVDLSKVAMAALSYLAYRYVAGPTSLLFLGATFYILHSACTQHNGTMGAVTSYLEKTHTFGASLWRGGVNQLQDTWKYFSKA